MKLIKIKCSFCAKNFYRPAGRINEAKKFGWKPYCSKECQNRAKNKQRFLKCSNPQCGNAFQRQLSDIRSSNAYCSISCAASANNSKYPKRKAKIKKCNYCHKEFKGGAKRYCSKKCKNNSQIINKEDVCIKIKEFYHKNRRIPLKKEFPHYNAAQERFGTWNKAVEAAGFRPNPVMFAKKHIANDGHKCDSFAEKIIDDWLYSNNIKHRRNISYPDSSYTADFLIGKKFVEFFGLTGELKKYDKNKILKEGLAEKYNIELIKIYPKDLFPISRLEKIIKI